MGNVGSSARNFLLEIDGKLVGRLFAAEGGNLKAEVVETKIGTSFSKHIGAIKVEDMVLKCGTGMSSTLYNWIGASLDDKHVRKNGAVVGMDYNGKPAVRLEFFNALVTGLTLPRLDKQSNENAYLVVTISPELTKTTKADPKTNAGVYGVLPKSWHIADFRLKIDGLEKECAYVSKIKSLTMKSSVVKDNLGDSRETTISPGNVEVSDLEITLPDNKAQGFQDWFQDFVVNGNSIGSAKKGTLEFFAPHSTTPYFKLELLGLGIISSSNAQSALKGPTGLPLNVVMYCQQMRFSADRAAIT